MHIPEISSVCAYISRGFLLNCSGQLSLAVAELVQAQGFITALSHLLLPG